MQLLQRSVLLLAFVPFEPLDCLVDDVFLGHALLLLVPDVLLDSPRGRLSNSRDVVHLD